MPNESAHILVAEDSPAILRLLGKLLERAGYRITLVQDGEEAVREFAKHTDDFALLILDVMLPKLTGEEVLEAVRRYSPEMPILLTTGYGENSISQALRDSGTIKIILKPWSSATLLAAVRETIEHKWPTKP